MLQRFLKDSAIYSVAGFLSRGISLLLVPLYTRALAPQAFGVIDLLAIFGSLVGLTVALEISQGVARYYLDVPTAGERRVYISTALWFSVVAYAVFTLVALLFAVPLSELVLGTEGLQGVFRVAVVAIALNGIYYLLHGLLRWRLQPGDYGIASILYVLVTGGVAVALVIGMRMGVVGIFYGQIAGALVGSAVSWWYSRDSYGLHFDLARCRKMLEFSLPLVPSSISVFFSIYVDRICIRELMGLPELGLYGIGFRFASVMGLLMVGFQGALMPLVYQHHGEGAAPPSLARIFRVFMILALPALAAISLFSPEIIRLFTTPEYHAAAGVLPFLAGASLLSSMYIFAPGLAITKRTRMIAVINVAAAVVNLALNLLLIPLLGISGAALATLTSAGAAFTAQMVLSQRLYPVPHAWPRIGGAIGVASLLIALGFGIASLSGSLLLSLGKLAVLVAAVPVLAWLLLDSSEVRVLARWTAVRLQRAV